MVDELPPRLKNIVRELLLADNFKAAKAIHDQWFAEQQLKNPVDQPDDQEQDGADPLTELAGPINTLEYIVHRGHTRHSSHGRGDQI